MAAFRCKRFPQGVAHVRTRLGIVDFTDGKAVVDDPELAAALREVPDAFQISEVGGGRGSAGSDAKEALDTFTSDLQSGGPEPKAELVTYTAPGERDNKPAWVDWAVHNGADRAEAESMTKKDLIAAFG